MVTNPQSGTNVHEVVDGIYRINTPFALPGGTFSFNQYLVVDDDPLLFHTGPRRLFALVREAVEAILPASRLRHVGFSHVEADECGALNEWLAIAPQALPLCSRVASADRLRCAREKAPPGAAPRVEARGARCCAAAALAFIDRSRSSRHRSSSVLLALRQSLGVPQRAAARPKLSASGARLRGSGNPASMRVTAGCARQTRRMLEVAGVLKRTTNTATPRRKGP